MILDNITFDVPATLLNLKVEFLSAFNIDMQTLFAKQLKQEKLQGFGTNSLSLITYWAVFSLCVIIKHETVVTTDVAYTTYNALYDLDTIANNLQKVNIDITKVYAIFDLFGYSN